MNPFRAGGSDLGVVDTLRVQHVVGPVKASQRVVFNESNASIKNAVAGREWWKLVSYSYQWNPLVGQGKGGVVGINPDSRNEASMDVAILVKKGVRLRLASSSFGGSVTHETAIWHGVGSTATTEMASLGIYNSDAAVDTGFITITMRIQVSGFK